MILKEMSFDERPREKALRLGVNQLSNNELIALILRTGTKDESVLILSQKVLNSVGGIENLSNLNYHTLTSLKGIKEAKAIELLACIELAKRIRETPIPKEQVLSSKAIFSRYKHQFLFEKQERFFVLFLDTKHHIIKEKTIFIGGLNSSVVHPREIYKEALSCSCASIVCIHNHPSGNCEPSIEDIDTTRILYEAGKTVGIRLLDHLIFGDNQYYSFAEHGII